MQTLACDCSSRPREATPPPRRRASPPRPPLCSFFRTGKDESIPRRPPHLPLSSRPRKDSRGQHGDGAPCCCLTGMKRWRGDERGRPVKTSRIVHGLVHREQERRHETGRRRCTPSSSVTPRRPRLYPKASRGGAHARRGVRLARRWIGGGKSTATTEIAFVCCRNVRLLGTHSASGAPWGGGGGGGNTTRSDEKSRTG